jgi:hypothetical protein
MRDRVPMRYPPRPTADGARPDGSTPFVLAGKVRAWEPIPRWLWIGDLRLSVAPETVMDNFRPGDSVTVSGHYPRGHADDRGVWVVTRVRRPLG